MRSVSNLETSLKFCWRVADKLTMDDLQSGAIECIRRGGGPSATQPQIRRSAYSPSIFLEVHK